MTGRLRFVILPPVSDKLHGWAAKLARDVPELSVEVAETVQQANRCIGAADAALGPLSPELLAKAVRLRWLQAGYAAPPVGFFFDELAESEVVVTNLRGAYTEHVAAHVMAFVLALARGFQRYLPDQLARTWRPDLAPESVIDLRESTALVVGLGGVGQEVARLCGAFGCRVVGVDARLRTWDGVEVHPPGELNSLLPSSDIVVVTVPHTPETESMFDSARFAQFRRGSVFINIGRGGTVRLEALVEALNANVLSGAALDVFDPEPLPPDHPLWSAPNVLITPHVAYAGPRVDKNQYIIVRENARRFVRGEPLVNVVDKSRWY